MKAIHDPLLEVIHLKFESGADLARQILNWWDDGGAMGRESWFRATLLGFLEGKAWVRVLEPGSTQIGVLSTDRRSRANILLSNAEKQITLI